ncbi:MAG TPA: DUF4043 family protein, partial [Candidatus Cloacimonadota bacterium]|nr:DUF4043 family protein [Candidatus Cloacimonadota bacterium]
MIRNSALANAVTALDAKMRREAKQHLFWSRFTGEIEWSETPYNEPSAKMSGKFIEVSKKKATGLGDRMIFPMLLELAGPGRRGDAVLLGYEEDMARKYSMIAYNQIRHAVPVMKGRKDDSNEKLFNMMEYAMPQLAFWHAQQE